MPLRFCNERSCSRKRNGMDAMVKPTAVRFGKCCRTRERHNFSRCQIGILNCFSGLSSRFAARAARPGASTPYSGSWKKAAKQAVTGSLPSAALQQGRQVCRCGRALWDHLSDKPDSSRSSHGMTRRWGLVLLRMRFRKCPVCHSGQVRRGRTLIRKPDISVSTANTDVCRLFLSPITSRQIALA